MNSLSDVVDGRTWPENQEPEVGSQALQALGSTTLFHSCMCHSVWYSICTNSARIWLYHAYHDHPGVDSTVHPDA